MNESDTKEHAEERKKPFPYYVDSVRRETEKRSLTGAEIKAMAGITATYQLFLEEEGDRPDKQIADGEAVELKEGEHTRHFYAVPPATFGLK